jgi:hypothetical protein
VQEEVQEAVEASRLAAEVDTQIVEADTAVLVAAVLELLVQEKE